LERWRKEDGRVGMMLTVIGVVGVVWGTVLVIGMGETWQGRQWVFEAGQGRSRERGLLQGVEEERGAYRDEDDAENGEVPAAAAAGEGGGEEPRAEGQDGWR
jgi:hypothetical protein